MSVQKKQKIPYEKSLQYKNPELAKQWHPTKNKKLTPRDVGIYLKNKVWWKCKKGHEWQALVKNRNGYGCPYCSGRNAWKDNCLATLRPAIAKEWHPEKNGTLTPKDVKPGSHKKVWWKCKKGHEWETIVLLRKKGYGCPYCSNQKVCKDNCLETLYPALAREWHPEKNGNLTPKDVIPGSRKKVWWKCFYGHEWQAILNNRSSGKNCPGCYIKLRKEGYYNK